MTRRSRHRAAVLVALALLPMLARPLWAGDSKAQSTFGSNFFQVSPRCPVRQFPTFESIVPVPAILDPFQGDIPLFCQITVRNGDRDVNKAKGTFETDLIVIDNNSGMSESFPVKSGRFKTDSSGHASFDFELPAELFADGFESGDVSAWSYTRSTFSNKKKADFGAVQCGTSASRSD